MNGEMENCDIFMKQLSAEVCLNIEYHALSAIFLASDFFNKELSAEVCLNVGYHALSTLILACHNVYDAESELTPKLIVAQGKETKETL